MIIKLEQLKGLAQKGRLLFLVLAVIMLTGCSTKSAGAYYKEGIKYFKKSDYIKAEENFVKAIEKNKNKAEYFIDYGMTLIMLEDYDSAVTMFDKAMLDKDNAIVRKNNKMALRGKGIAYYYSNQYLSSVEELEKALSIKDNAELNTDIRSYLASSLERAGLYEKALDAYETILKEGNAKGEIYFKRASLYSKLGRYEESIAEYEEAITEEKDNYDYYFGKYFALTANGQEEEGKVLLESLIIPKEGEKSSASPEDNYNLAKAYYYLGEYEEASSRLQESILLGFTSAYYYLGQIAEEQNNYEEAIYNYNNYLADEKNEKTGAVYNQLGLNYFKLGQYTEGLETISEGLTLNDILEEQSLKRNEIIGLEHLGKYEDAAKKVREYLLVYPNDEEAKREYEFIKTRVK